MSKPTMKIVIDDVDKLLNIFKQFKNTDVLVGVPEDETERDKTKDSSDITNAQLMFIHEYGSPVNNIPARPVMKIGIEKSKEDVAEQFKLAAQNAFNQGQDAIETYYNRAGFIASSAIKNVINDQEGIAPISFYTELERKRRGFNGEKALIVTGQLRNSITHVVREKEQ